MNKYSDNLKVDCEQTQDLNAVPEIVCLPADFRESDNAMFVAIIHGWVDFGTDKLDITIVEGKEGDLDNQDLFQVTGITPNLDVGFGAYAFDVKAEDLSLEDGYVLAKCKLTKTGGGEASKPITLIKVVNSDHLHFDKMGHYNEVFDRLHLTPVSGGVAPS